jgi:hypothetical protein
MISSRRIGRKVCAALAVTGVSCGLAVAAAGTAQAKVANAWGYALVLKPSGLVDPSHWRESVPSPTPTASPGLPGQVTVKFPRIGYFKGGVVHVTPVIDVLAWCDAQRWRTLAGNELVTVRCFRKGGIPAFTPFTVMFSQSSGTLPGGLSYAYVHDTGTAISSSFNSSGMANTVTTVSPGVWKVHLNGNGPATQSGSLQVTAASPTKAAICDIGGQVSTPSGQSITVRCFSAIGAPLKTGWNLTYQRGRAITGARPKQFAYTLNNKPLIAGPYTPVPPGVNFNSLGAINTIKRSGFGESLIQFRRVGILPDTVLVSAASKAARVCNLNTQWVTTLPPTSSVIVRDVVCYQVSGVMTPTISFVTYTH